jgi:hypothetical protein
MAEAATAHRAVAFNWIDAIRRKTVKNMTHVEYVHKYSRVRHSVDQLVLILTGLRFLSKEYFLIRIHGALYEPFVGPHYVQIGDETPFWVHSLTAFRREFFGLTDKLSFERSVFVGLSNGEVVRLKIARPYLFMPHNVALAPGSRLRIMKTPSDSFMVAERDIIKHKDELCDKKRRALETNQAVRTRVRNHLVGSVQLLFCSYMRDTNIAPEQAHLWFHTDMQHAMAQCETLYASFTRVRPNVDAADHLAEQAFAEGGGPVLMTNTADISGMLINMSSRVDHNVSEMMRDARVRERASPGAVQALLGSGGGVALGANPYALAEYLTASAMEIDGPRENLL